MLSESCSDESVLASRRLVTSTVVERRCTESQDTTRRRIARHILDATTRFMFPKLLPRPQSHAATRLTGFTWLVGYRANSPPEDSEYKRVQTLSLGVERFA